MSSYFRRSVRRQSANLKIQRRRHGSAVEKLESRVVLNATLSAAIPAQGALVNSVPTTLNLNQYFTDPNVTGTAVLMQTNEGNIPLTLDDSQVSTTVQNFLHYVNSGEYNNTFIHRVATVATSGIGIVQGGGYTTNGNSIPTIAPIPLQGNLPNSQYTIAMARTSVPNSATSEWFFNATDNSSTLPPGNAGGYAVFGTALYGGPTTINSIYNLTLASYNTVDGPLIGTVPTTDGNSGFATPNDLVVIQQAAVVNPLSYTVSSDNTGLVAPIVSGSNLSLNYAPGQVGSAHITVTATDLGGSTASTTFPVTVMPSGVTVIGNQLYIVGGATSNDHVQVDPVGASNTGSTGVKVQTQLNGVNTQTTYTQSFSTINIALQNGNENVQLANSLTINAVITAGNGTDNIQLGNGNNTVTLGNGNDNIQAGTGMNTILAGNGNDNVHLGNGSGNSVTLGNGNDNVQIGNGSNEFIMVGNGNDNVQLGDGSFDDVTIGSGNDGVQIGNGNNNTVFLPLLGNPNAHVKFGNGSNNTIQKGGGGGAGGGGAT